MVLTLLVSIITILLFILSSLFLPSLKIKKITISTFWIIPLLGAIILLATSQAPIEEVLASFTSSSAVNPIKVLILFISMTFLSIYLDEAGFFSYLALFFTKKFSSKQIYLFLCLYVLISILTIFTSNDIIILTFTPFICYFCKKCKIDPLPYLISEFVAANTYSCFLIIGNPTNIYLASYENISFFSYFINMAIPTLGCGLVSFVILFLLFRKRLSKPIEIDNKDEQVKIDRISIGFGLFSLIGATIMLAISSYINLPMYLISLGFALFLLMFSIIYSLVKKKDHVLPSLKRIPYNLIPFVLSMFIIVLALTNAGITKELASFLNKFNTTYSYGIAGLISANLINNIPMAVLFSSLLDNVGIKAIYASILASNLAAFLTPIGALAGIMWTSLVKKYGVKMDYLTFIKYGAIISIPTLLVGLTIIELMPIF